MNPQYNSVYDDPRVKAAKQRIDQKQKELNRKMQEMDIINRELKSLGLKLNQEISAAQLRAKKQEEVKRKEEQARQQANYQQSRAVKDEVSGAKKQQGGGSFF